MNDLVAYHIPEAVRIEVVKVDSCYGYAGDDSSYDVRRFTVDPQVTGIGVLQSILVKAFNLRSDFNLSYYRPDVASYAPLRNEWDLDTAFITCSRPFLQIKLQVDRRQHGLSDWDIITVADLTKAAAQSAAHRTQNMANSFLDRVEKLASRVTLLGLAGNSKNSSFASVPSSPESVGSSSSSGSAPSGPLTDKQYHAFLDAEGRLKGQRELRISTFRRGVEAGLRKAAWKQLLNVYPPGLTGQQRVDYMKTKSELYYQLRNLWQTNLGDPQVECIHNMVKKDVLRTDRSHSFYSGPEENTNLTALLNILTTFSLNHSVRYCQGMSDLASPILYAMRGDEPHAYACFCALMKRMSENFSTDGHAMSRKFQHLVQLLLYYDPEFYCYLKQNNAHELLFCYRWILLELKREFALDDALTMIEVLWSSVPPTHTTDLPLYDKEAIFRPGFSPLVNSTNSTDSACTMNNSMDSMTLTGSSVKNASSYDRQTLMGSFPENSSPKHHNQHGGLNGASNGGGQRNKHNSGGSRSLETTVKLGDEELNCSSGRGSLSTYSSLGNTSVNSASQAIDVPKPQRPLRRIRFLPKILSTDSREIDSPEEEEFTRSTQLHYSLPPKFIDKQFSIDYEDGCERRSNRATPTRLVGSFEDERRNARTGQRSDSLDRDDHRRGPVRSFDATDDRLQRNGSFGSLSPKRRFRLQNRLAETRAASNSGSRAKLLRQRNASEESNYSFTRSIDAESCDDYLVHCSGDYSERGGHGAGTGKDWTIPRGLVARSLSWDSLRDSPQASRQNSRDDAPFWDSCGEHLQDTMYHSGGLNGNRSTSQSSSCSSLVILSTSGNVVGTCSQRLRASLPSPQELGSNSAFMLFLCLTMLLQHRDIIMSRGYDSNEIAMYFDALVRKHKVKAVLDSGRHLFHSYLSHWQRNHVEQEVEPLKGFYVNGAAYLSGHVQHEQRCGL